MVNRVFVDGSIPRIICSKPGYNADLSLANEYKTFDSNWYYGGGIRWILNSNITSGQSTFTLFPYALNYRPRVNTFLTVQWFGNDYLFPNSIPGVSGWNPPQGGWVLDPDTVGSVATVSLSSISGTQPVPNGHLFGGGRCISVVYGD